jgi:hypothetical protein
MNIFAEVDKSIKQFFNDFQIIVKSPTIISETFLCNDLPIKYPMKAMRSHFPWLSFLLGQKKKCFPYFLLALPFRTVGSNIRESKTLDLFTPFRTIGTEGFFWSSKNNKSKYLKMTVLAFHHSVELVISRHPIFPLMDLLLFSRFNCLKLRKIISLLDRV